MVIVLSVRGPQKEATSKKRSSKVIHFSFILLSLLTISCITTTANQEIDLSPSNKSRHIAQSPEVHRAIQAKDYDKLSKLLSIGVINLEVRDKPRRVQGGFWDQGYTALEYAIHLGDILAVNMLISAGAHVDQGLIQHAACTSHPQMEKIIQVLLTKTGYTSTTGEYQHTPLHTAVHCNELENVQTFLKLTAGDINTQNKQGNTPLHLAVSKSRNILALLVHTTGIKLNIRNNDGNTPVHLATHDPEKIKELSQAGANLNIMNNMGLTPLQQTKSQDTAITLLQLGAEINMQAQYNMLVISTISKQGELEVAKDLLYNNVSAYRENYNEDGFRSIMNGVFCSATAFDDTNTMHILLEDFNIDVNLQLCLGYDDFDDGKEDIFTPLHVAARLGNTNAVKWLVQAGAKINKRTLKRHKEIEWPLEWRTKYDRYTALYLAVDYNHIETVKALIELGAKLNIKDEYGQTALDEAYKNNNQTIIQILENAGAKRG